MRFIKIVLLSLQLFSALQFLAVDQAFADGDASFHFLNVFGNNDRKNVARDAKIRRLVGRLTVPSGAHCTASLIWKNLILTAAHCLMNNGQFAKGEYVFALGKLGNRVLATSGVNYAWWGTTQTELDREHDYAVLRLTTPLGDEFGYFGWYSKEDLTGQQLYAAGYGVLADPESLSVSSQQCSILQKLSDGGLYLHDCDTSRGDSGGPLYTCNDTDGCMIYALTVSEYRHGGETSLQVSAWSVDESNIGVQATNFAEFVANLRKENN